MSQTIEDRTSSCESAKTLSGGPQLTETLHQPNIVTDTRHLPYRTALQRSRKGNSRNGPQDRRSAREASREHHCSRSRIRLFGRRQDPCSAQQDIPTQVAAKLAATHNSFLRTSITQLGRYPDLPRAGLIYFSFVPLPYSRLIALVAKGCIPGFLIIPTQVKQQSSGSLKFRIYGSMYSRLYLLNSSKQYAICSFDSSMIYLSLSLLILSSSYFVNLCCCVSLSGKIVSLQDVLYCCLDKPLNLPVGSLVFCHAQ